MSHKEFLGVRSRLYKELMKEFPDAREEERILAMRHLHPQKGEKILEIGAGAGFFSQKIAEAIEEGILIATDPSLEQLESVAKLSPNIQVVQAGASNLPAFPDNEFDAIWSGASFHHVHDKTLAFIDFYRLLKKGGRLVILDVFAGTALAKHFDQEVAKYSITGHEVSFLTEEFSESLCYLAGFEKPTFSHETIYWKFSTKQDLGTFIYKMHGMTKSTPEQCGQRAEEILGLSYKDNAYHLNWPLTILTTYKR